MRLRTNPTLHRYQEQMRVLAFLNYSIFPREFMQILIKNIHTSFVLYAILINLGFLGMSRTNVGMI